MNKTNLVTGIISFIIAILLYVFGANAYGVEMGNTTINLYPSAFFALIGVVQVFRAFVYKRS